MGKNTKKKKRKVHDLRNYIGNRYLRLWHQNNPLAFPTSWVNKIGSQTA